MSSTRQEPQGPRSEEERERRQVPVDLVGGLSLLVIVVIFLVRAGEANRDWIFPIVLSYALGVMAVYLVVRGLLGRGDRILAVPPLLRGEGTDVGVFTLLTVAYVVLLRPIGFWITTSLMIVAGASYLDTKLSRRSLAISVVVAVAISVGAFLLLTRVFYVPVPRARWAPWNN